MFIADLVDSFNLRLASLSVELMERLLEFIMDRLTALKCLLLQFFIDDILFYGC